MQKTILSVFLLFVSLIASGQDWKTDLDEAKKEALEKNHNIVLVFQGSDWCAPCIKLEKEIWSSSEFKSYSKGNFVLLKADFPRKKNNSLSKIQQENNNKLAEKYNTKGYFPFVVVLDKTGKVLGSTGYKKISPTEYIKILSSF